MIKFIGAGIVLITSSLIGYLYGENLKKRVNNLKEFERSMYHLKNEISYSHSLLYQAFSTVAERSKEPVNKVFIHISKSLEEGVCDSVYDAFYKAFEKYKQELLFLKEDVDIFLNLSKTLGEINLDSQEDMFELSIMNLKKNIENGEEKLKKNLKMYRYLGFTIGAMITIIFI
ncbi:stage III sporulation protein SpoIIIAB [Clostridium ihumii]|uniref:stage III sporulation protein SpoIIIAB n=1 Tax=Clostridium ihumii TaxID=1470356 RepID=UPI00058D43FD|nr:stage III sporulation protein SpoIIIAB [Clostridium ihumii]